MTQAQLELDAPTGLSVVQALCRELDRREIVYCHFKSNEHLLEGMCGLTDLDVLVERESRKQLALALSSAGFKRFNAVAGNGYPAVEDYLALDGDTGKLIHLHLHYQLVCGEPHLKGYRLPWEKQVLATRVYRAREQIYTTEPHMEMLLLVVRSALKLRLRDSLLERLDKRFFDGERLREYNWLKARTDTEKTLQLGAAMLGELITPALENLLTAVFPTLRQLKEFRHHIALTLRPYRTYSAAQARSRRTFNEARWLLGGINKRYIHAPVPMRRVSATGGLLIALMGCDGCGKSTHLQSLRGWLGWKIDVVPVYFGSGDGSVSLLRWPLKLVADAVRKSPNYRSSRYKLQGADTAGEGRGGQISATSWRVFAKALWALVLSMEKRAKLRSATMARNRGMVVICDRYPQNQVMGFNDGPLLDAWLKHDSRLLQSIARWERVPYEMAEQYPPDLVVKLNLSAELAVQRKPEMNIEECRRRIAAIQALAYPATTESLQLDAHQPLPDVLNELQKRIWAKL